MPLERDLIATCKRCHGTGVAITLSSRGRQHTWICTCPAGLSIAAPVRGSGQDRRRHG